MAKNGHRQRDGPSHGEVSLLHALTRSYNQATVRLGLEIGVNNLPQVEQLASIPIDAPSVFLGELTPEVTQAYQSIAVYGYSVLAFSHRSANSRWRRVALLDA
jgi:penicillin-binding protein 1B